jgi:tRNA (guanine-N7-)-methyltransferase
MGLMRHQTGPPPLDWLSQAAQRIELAPANYFVRLDLAAVFPRSAPVDLDVGCGEGAFLLTIAAAHPERNYLAIERMLGRVHTVSRSVAKAGLENVRIVRIDSRYAIEHLLPPSSIDRAHILFPDPWPKRAHHSRRLIQEPFLRALHRVLKPSGEARIKTDDLPYFQWMEKVFARVASLFAVVDWPADEAYPVTDFERKFVNQGLPIYRARLRKI